MFFARIKEYYKNYRDKRFLKKHHCKNWDDYNWRFDPDINFYATELSNFYAHYPYYHIFTNYNSYCYHIEDGDNYGWKVIYNWCKEKTKHKFRSDSHRLFNSDSTENRWAMSWMGRDYIVFAFKDKKDYDWFLLRWVD